MISSGRIALVLGSCTGGTGRHVASLAERLGAAGVPVTVLGPAATETQFGFTAVGARFVAVEIPASPRPADVRAVLALRRALGRAVGDRFEVVHAHGLRAAVVASLARPRGLPLVVTWHNLVLATGLRGRLHHFLERYVARSADRTLCVSADLVARARRLGATNAGLAVVPAPPLTPATRSRDVVRAELSRIAATPADADRPVVLSVGRLHPQKGHDVLIAAAARWRDRQPVPLVLIAGGGPAERELADQIAASGAPVTLLGHRTDVADLLAAADVVVATSVWEGQPLLVQEVLAAGVPLVATAVGGVPDIVGDTAVLVAVADIDAVDASVRRLLDDQDLRAEYARRGLARAATWPTEADSVAQVAAVYTELGAAVRTGGRG